MSVEQEFAQELLAQYREQGWVVEDPASARAEIGFEPDLLLRRDNEQLVLELKKEGFKSSRAVKILRDLVNKKEGWRFELKFVPSNFARKAHPLGEEYLQKRLQLAKALEARNFSSEAFIVAWPVLEALLRSGLESTERDETMPTTRLFRQAYEDGLVSEAELQELQRGFQVRNRIVHGLSVTAIDQDVVEALSLADALLKRSSPARVVQSAFGNGLG